MHSVRAKNLKAAVAVAVASLSVGCTPEEAAVFTVTASANQLSITSQLPTTALSSQMMSHQVETFLKKQGSLQSAAVTWTYELTKGPTGANLSHSGELTFLPLETQAGAYYPLGVRVTAAYGSKVLVAEQEVQLLVISGCTQGYALQLKDDAGSLIASVITFDGDETAFENGNYRSHSMHMINGPAQIGNQSTIFGYRQRGVPGYAATVVAGVDGGGSQYSTLAFTVDVGGNLDGNLQPQDYVALCDDPGECTSSYQDGKSSHVLDAEYWLNTDGMVVDGIINQNSYVDILAVDLGDVNELKFVSASQASFILPTTPGTRVRLEYEAVQCFGSGSSGSAGGGSGPGEVQ